MSASWENDVALLTPGGEVEERAVNKKHLKNVLSLLWTSVLQKRESAATSTRHGDMPKASSPHSCSGEWASGPQKRKIWPKQVPFLAKGSQSHDQLRNVIAPSCLTAPLGDLQTPGQWFSQVHLAQNPLEAC